MFVELCILIVTNKAYNFWETLKHLLELLPSHGYFIKTILDNLTKTTIWLFKFALLPVRTPDIYTILHNDQVIFSENRLDYLVWLNS